MSAVINTFTMAGIVPVFGQEPKRQNVRLAASQTLAAGTVLGEITPANEEQTVTLNGSPTGGSFKLTFGGFTTVSIAHNAAASAVQSALEALPSIRSGNVSVTGSAGGPYTVIFTNDLGKRNVAQLTSVNALTGDGDEAVAHATTVPGTGGEFKAYASGNSDGSQLPKAILEFACAVDSSGKITLGGATGGDDKQRTFDGVPAFFKGTFNTAELTGFDQNCIDVGLGHLISGSVASGVFRMP